MDDLIANLSKESKRLDISFLSLYDDPYIHKKGIIFVAKDKRVVYFNDNMLRIWDNISNKPKIYFDAYCIPNEVITTLRKYV